MQPWLGLGIPWHSVGGPNGLVPEGSINIFGTAAPPGGRMTSLGFLAACWSHIHAGFQESVSQAVKVEDTELLGSSKVQSWSLLPHSIGQN